MLTVGDKEAKAVVAGAASCCVPAGGLSDAIACGKIALAGNVEFEFPFVPSGDEFAASGASLRGPAFESGAISRGSVDIEVADGAGSFPPCDASICENEHATK